MVVIGLRSENRDVLKNENKRLWVSVLLLFSSDAIKMKRCSSFYGFLLGVSIISAVEAIVVNPGENVMFCWMFFGVVAVQ